MRNEASTFPPPPPTDVRPVEEVLHGHRLVDDYRWLEDQEGPETRAWIDAQNDYTDRLLASCPARAALHELFARLMRVDFVGPPLVRGGRYFHARRLAAEDRMRLCVREEEDGEERVLVDPDELEADDTLMVELVCVAHDGARIAYAVRAGGRDEVEIRFRDVATGEDLPDVLPPARYHGLHLLHDGDRYVFVRREAEGPRLRIGTFGRAGHDLLFGERYGPEKIIYTVLDPEGRHLVVHVLDGSAPAKTEVWLLDLAGDAGANPVSTDLEATFQGDVAGGRLYLHTNHEAPNGRVLAVDVADPRREHWTEVVPERPDAVIQGVSPAGGRLVVHYLKDVHSRIAVFGPQGAPLGEIPLGTIGTVAGVVGTWDDARPFLALTSFHVRWRVLRVDLDTLSTKVFFEAETPIDVGDLEVEQVRFRSKDGTEVPMFLVHRRGIPRDGRRPTSLTGYGGFRATLSPGYTSLAPIWAERDGVYAVANLRGGAEFGEAWHRAGMREHKQNTFDDFFAASEWLVENGYTRPEQLAIMGGSNGGLLMGAALTQRPDLYQAVVCGHPLLDMIRYHRFLVGSYWVSEYGSADDPEAFRWLLAYSPYHRVESGVDYPATLLVTGDGDTRVAPLHARKMAALLQARSALRRPVMLRYHLDRGHAGAAPVRRMVEEAADRVAFLAWQLGA